jgi:hypothetical protein
MPGLVPWNVERGIFILFKQEQKQKPKQIQKKHKTISN